MSENLPNQEIIDATQNAVLNAAGGVVDALETTAHEISGHSELFYESSHFWVAVSFVLAVLLIARPVGKLVHAMLVKRGENIAKRIDDASQLKEDAQKLLAEYERKYRHAEAEAQEILTRSEREISLVKKENLANLEKDMANKERETTNRIASAQDAAAREVAEMATNMTLKIVKSTLIAKLDDKAHDKLIDESIDWVANRK